MRYQLKPLLIGLSLFSSTAFAFDCTGINIYPDWPQTNWQGVPSHANAGDKMVFDNKVYQAGWWTKQTPQNSSAWQYLGRCQSDIPTQPTPIEQYGQLSVCGTKLCSEKQQPIQLKGMSSHGLQWYGLDNCLTNASLDVLAYDWQSDVIRLSMYIQEGGYETNPQKFTAQMNTLIDMATQRGMYVIIDWHMLTPGDPNYNLTLAKTFFSLMAQQHNAKNNIIYEIANEPNGVAWAEVKTYADEVIPVIRQHDKNAVILVGTQAWSSLGVSDGRTYQDIINNPVQGENLMYTFHFYAASHKDKYRQALSNAADKLPIFVSEWGTQDNLGEGPNDLISAQQYIDLMKQKQISWINWNYSDDHRSGASWQRGTCRTSAFKDDSLKESGLWIKQQIMSK